MKPLRPLLEPGTLPLTAPPCIQMLGGLILVGCVPPGTGGPMRTDSAGVEIVTHSTLPLRTGVQLVVAPQPGWILGGSDGDPMVRITAVAALPGGEAVVADAGAFAVRAFSRSGEQRWSVGRRGHGPGEFTGDLGLATYADTTLVWDFTARRMTVIGPEGRVARVSSVPTGGPNLELVGAFTDGAAVMSARHLGNLGPGMHRDSMVYYRFSPRAEPVVIATGQGTRVFFAVAGAMPVVDDLPTERIPRRHAPAARGMADRRRSGRNPPRAAGP